MKTQLKFVALALSTAGILGLSVLQIATARPSDPGGRVLLLAQNGGNGPPGPHGSTPMVRLKPGIMMRSRKPVTFAFVSGKIISPGPEWRTRINCSDIAVSLQVQTGVAGRPIQVPQFATLSAGRASGNMRADGFCNYCVLAPLAKGHVRHVYLTSSNANFHVSGWIWGGVWKPVEITGGRETTVDWTPDIQVFH